MTKTSDVIRETPIKIRKEYYLTVTVYKLYKKYIM
jgi:hypothetical protein